MAQVVMFHSGDPGDRRGGQLTAVGQVKKGEPFSKDVTVTLDHDHPDQAYRLVAFVQEASEGKILGAAVMRIQ